MKVDPFPSGQYKYLAPFRCDRYNIPFRHVNAIMRDWPFCENSHHAISHDWQLRYIDSSTICASILDALIVSSKKFFIETAFNGLHTYLRIIGLGLSLKYLLF